MTDPCVRGLTDRAAVADRLVASGLGPEAACSKAELFEKAAYVLIESGIAGARRAHVFFVPGRIEVLGKHTDYGGGRSMVVAAERGFCMIATSREDSTVHVADAVLDAKVEFALDPDLVPNVSNWSNYPMVVARRVARNFPGLRRGADIAFASDLHPAAGMSSSSALIVGTFLALAATNDLTKNPQYHRHIQDREHLAAYLGTVENGQSFGSLEGDRGVGTFGGSEDHTAILCARPGQISQYSYGPVRFERAVSLSNDHVFAVGVSGVVAEKTGMTRDDYNRLARLAGAALDLWRQATTRDDPHLAAAIGSSPGAMDHLRRLLQNSTHCQFTPKELIERVEQFYEESEQIIPQVPDCLDVRTLTTFGRLVDRSQSKGATCLGNQVPQTVFLADSARQLGAAAASAFGAGFGGSVWALVKHEAAPRFLSAWAAQYHQAFPEQAEQAAFFAMRAGPAAIEWGS